MVRFDPLKFCQVRAEKQVTAKVPRVNVCRDVDRVFGAGHLLQLRDLLKLELSQSQVDRFRGSLKEKQFVSEGTRTFLVKNNPKNLCFLKK